MDFGKFIGLMNFGLGIAIVTTGRLPVLIGALVMLIGALRLSIKE